LTTAPPSLLLPLLFTKRRWATRHRIHIHTLDLLSSFGICCSPATYYPSQQGTPRWEPRFPLRLLLLLVRQVTGVCLGLPPRAQMEPDPLMASMHVAGTATAEASCEVQDHLPHGACLQICLVRWGISLFWLRSLFSVHGRLVAAPGSGLQFRARLWLLHGCGRLGWVLNVVVVLGKSSLDYLSVSVAMEPSGIMFPLGGIAKELPHALVSWPTVVVPQGVSLPRHQSTFEHLVVHVCASHPPSQWFLLL
jgi:hypothetical protein